jgi:hypothetical protein
MTHTHLLNHLADAHKHLRHVQRRPLGDSFVVSKINSAERDIKLALAYANDLFGTHPVDPAPEFYTADH